MWKVLAWISLSDKIFHETFSMKAPRSSLLFGFCPLSGGKVNREA